MTYRDARVFVVIGVLACAARPELHEAKAPATTEARVAPPSCAVDHGGPGWVEHRVAGTPVAFCAPPDIRHVKGWRQSGSAEPRPYPRAPNVPDWAEQWNRAGDGRWALIAARFTAPRGRPSLPPGATDLRHSVVAAAGDTAASAVLREYRVVADLARDRRPPGEEEFDGFGLGPERADLVVPLGPATWLVLEVNLETPADRAELVRVLRSARRVDR